MYERSDEERRGQNDWEERGITGVSFRGTTRRSPFSRRLDIREVKSASDTARVGLRDGRLSLQFVRRASARVKRLDGGSWRVEVDVAVYLFQRAGGQLVRSFGKL